MCKSNNKQAATVSACPEYSFYEVDDKDYTRQAFDYPHPSFPFIDWDYISEVPVKDSLCILIGKHEGNELLLNYLPDTSSIVDPLLTYDFGPWKLCIYAFKDHIQIDAGLNIFYDFDEVPDNMRELLSQDGQEPSNGIEYYQWIIPRDKGAGVLPDTYQPKQVLSETCR